MADAIGKGKIFAQACLRFAPWPVTEKLSYAPAAQWMDHLELCGIKREFFRLDLFRLDWHHIIGARALLPLSYLEFNGLAVT